MRKKIMVLTFVFCMVTQLFVSTNIKAAEVRDEGYYNYVVIDGNAQIRYIHSINGGITIPSRLGGYPVTTIRYGAFARCEGLTSVVIPGSVTSIETAAFSMCYNLTYVSIGNNVTNIGDKAFGWCNNLTSIIIGKNVTSIGALAFNGCNSLTDIYFFGTEKDWNKISLAEGNENLTNATIHFLSTIPVSSVTMMNTSATIKIGDTFQAQAYCTPANATNKKLTWTSNNTYVATVNHNGFVTAKAPGTATITARSSNGKSASCIITVENKNVINYDDFKYDFWNKDTSFGYDEDSKIPLERYFQAGIKNPFQYFRALGSWSGNCFGMSASSILFFKDNLREEKYDQTVSQPLYFDDPNSDSENDVLLREMIELLQVSQYRGYDTKEWFWKPIDIANQIDIGNPVMLLLGAGFAGHAVVIYDYQLKDGYYIFSIYDCSYFVDYLVVNDEKKGYFIYNERENSDKYDWRVSGIIFYDEIAKQLKKMRDNNLGNAISLLSAEPTYTYIFRPAEDITITNSSGQISTIIDGEVSGEIEDIRVTPSSYLAEEPIYTISLPTDTYTIIGSGEEEITTSFADDYMSASVTAKSSTPITISSDLKEINVETLENEEYNITYTTYDNIFDEMNLSGTAAGTVTSKLNDTDITIAGIDTLTASASVSESEISSNAENLADCDITVKCEESDNGATLQILSSDTELTEKTALPERLQADAPVYDLESGTYTEGQTLTFTDDDETIIYYTTDGSIPSADNGIIYSLPIDINKSMTINAISTKYGYLDSEIVELNYELPEVEAPQASLESGEYDNVISVDLSTSDYFDNIYYTIDGSDPIENGILYTVPINITEDTLLQAYTARNGCISEISEYEYIITPEHPIYFSNSLTNQDGDIITAENIADITKVKMTVSKLQEGDHSGVFLIAFYGEGDRLIYSNYTLASIDEDIDEVEIDITSDVSSAHKIKAFAWSELSNIEPLCEILEETLIEE